MAEAKTYRSSIPSIQYMFKDGRPAWFIDHLFKTSDPEKIAQLDAEIKANHPYFSHAGEEEAAKVLDENDIVGSMRERIRREVIEEEKAKMRAASGDAKRDMGTYEAPTNLNPASSADAPMALEASAIVNATEAAAQTVENVQTAEIPSASRSKLQSLLGR